MKRPPPARQLVSPTDPGRALEVLREATAALAEGAGDSTQTLRLALDLLLEVTGADAGAVAVPGSSNGRPTLLAQRSVEAAGPVCMTVLEAALSDGDGRATIGEPPATASALDAGITSVLCLPVRRHGQTLAAVYLDRRGKPSFDETARTLARSFASTLALGFDLTRQVEETLEQAAEARAAAAHLKGYWRFGDVVTQSRAYAGCLELAERIASSDSTALILGETGSGKEHLARCIHAGSARARGPFLVVNCAAIPETLLESELFGYERGAFTGAVDHRAGKFELAGGGTLLLDEIGELPLQLQPKLLRVLDTKRCARLGGGEERAVDVRILAATNLDLPAEARSGRFREDLLYRLDVVTLRIPPLRDRVEDIPPLARAFLEVECRRQRRKLRWDAATLRRLAQRRWPGNVRELKNAVERLCLLAEGPVLRTTDMDQHLPSPPEPIALEPAPGRQPGIQSRMATAEAEIRRISNALESLLERLGKGGAVVPASAAQGTGTFREQVAEASRQVIVHALEQAGSLSGAATLLGLSRQGLWMQCRRLGLRKALSAKA